MEQEVLVVENIPSNCVAMGTPAKAICDIEVFLKNMSD